MGGGLLLWVSTLEMPSFDSFTERVIAKSTKIYDRTGEVLLYDVYKDVKRQVVPFDQISEHIKNATLAIEDSGFYQHTGVKPLSILRAFLVNISAGENLQGGSTITQQLVKKALLTDEKLWTRKIKELVLALKLEQQLSKDDILGHYLNEMPYGGSIYGVEEASRAYFNQPAAELGIAESAYLAAMLKAPTYYSPFGKNRDKLDERKNVVINRMAELGFIPLDIAEAEKVREIEFLPRGERGIKAPHFVLWIREYLAEKYGEEALHARGLKVTTTLDWELQEIAERIVGEYGASNKEKFNADNAALTAIDPKTGQVLVMVGSKDYFNTADNGNFNIALAHRQPGSAFKPFAYAEAFNKGFAPETMIFDLETQFDTACARGGNCYKPSNYDDKFRGPMSFREALAQSINIPAIKVLYLAGLRDTLNLAKNMGITSLGNASQYGLTLVLGGGEVSLLDMTSAYGVFANDGLRLPYSNVLKIEDDGGKIIEEYSPRPNRVLPENSARLISSILSDNAARIPSYAPGGPLEFRDRAVAVKTGTTNDYKDAWILGYTPNLVAGAWVGNSYNTPMEKKVAGLIVAPLWRAFMDEALKLVPPASFPTPEPTSTEILPVMRGYWKGSHGYFIDSISGKLATEYTPPELREERVLTQVHSILYWLNRHDDPQFPLWEEPIRRWVAAQNIREEDESNIPTELDDVHGPDKLPRIQVLSPDDSQRHDPRQLISFHFNYQGQYPLASLEFFFNEEYLGSSNQAPFTFSFRPSDYSPVNTNNELRIVTKDVVGNRDTTIVSLRFLPIN